jgi:hypothetical protein
MAHVWPSLGDGMSGEGPPPAPFNGAESELGDNYPAATGRHGAPTSVLT